MNFPLRFFLLLSLVLGASTANAQPQAAKTPTASGAPATLRVATRIVPPFVTKQGDAYGGFSMDLWKALATEMNVRSQFIEAGKVKELLAKVQSKQADVGIAAISITAEREEMLDFSQPMFSSGMQILVRDDTGNSGPSLLRTYFSPVMLQALLVVALMTIIPAHLIWLIERNHEDGIIENKKYFPGIFKAFWWAAGTLGAQVDEMPKSPWGRVLALYWMFTGIAFVAYFTAMITTAMTVQQLQGDINSVDDLKGNHVATVAGSTSEKYLRERGIQVSGFARFEDAAQALGKNEVKAVVFDAPVLLYYAGNEGKGKAHVVGSVFRPENYGIAFPTGSPWRRRVNYALLKLREEGTYDTLYAKWFGASEGS